MPAILANISKFRLSTDFPLDKIVYIKEDSFTIPASDTASTSVAHGLTFTPLMEGTWSTSPDFTSATSYDMGSGPASTTPFFLFNVAPVVSATSSNVIIGGTNVTGSPITVYYRVFGYEPSNVNLEAPHTSGLADKFTLNSDFNYAKLYLKDIVTGNATISHSLGYKPQVSLWEEFSGTTYKKNDNNILSGNTLAKVTTTSLSIIYGGGAPPGTKVHYRIYLDE